MRSLHATVCLLSACASKARCKDERTQNPGNLNSSTSSFPARSWHENLLFESFGESSEAAAVENEEINAETPLNKQRGSPTRHAVEDPCQQCWKNIILFGRTERSRNANQIKENRKRRAVEG